MATSAQTARRLTLAWGVHSVEVPPMATLDEMSAYACEAVVREGLAVKGDTVIVAAGTPVGVPGGTNTIKILRV